MSQPEVSEPIQLAARNTQVLLVEDDEPSAIFATVSHSVVEVMAGRRRDPTIEHGHEPTGRQVLPSAVLWRQG